MEQYIVYYADVAIGCLTVDTATGRHKYEPYAEAVSPLVKNHPIFTFLMKETDGFVDPLPFFSTRLKYLHQWNLEEISYQTDNYRIRKRSAE